MTSDNWRTSRRAALIGAALLAVAGCRLGDLLPHYSGPMPERDPIFNERVVVRQLLPSSVHPGAAGGFYGERTRYLQAGDPHNVNRVIRVAGGTLHTELAALGIQAGDTLVISTQYDTTAYDALAPGVVPDWPGHTQFEYPIARHTLTAIARVPRGGG